MRFAVACVISVLFLVGTSVAQEAPSPLIGSWHNIANPKYPQALMIFSADGYYAQIAVPPGRSKPKNDFEHRSREELMKQFGGFLASYGSWKTDGAKLIRVRTASEDPGVEGTEVVAEFRFDGDVLVLTGQDGHAEGRFRRMR